MQRDNYIATIAIWQIQWDKWNYTNVVWQIQCEKFNATNVLLYLDPYIPFKIQMKREMNLH